MFHIQLFGEFGVTIAGETLTRFRTRKTAELLAYLAYHCRHRQPREILVDLLWPECDTDSGRHNLSMALSSLRQQWNQIQAETAADFLVADRHSVGLNPHLLTTDVAEFEAALLAAGRARTPDEQILFLTKAVDLYAGELLPGFYEDWIFPEQQRLMELYFDAHRHLIALLEQNRELGRALHYALRSLRMDRRRESLHRDVMRLYAARGEVDAATRHFRELERFLEEQGEDGPTEETRALLQAIQSAPPLPAAASQPPTPPALPVPESGPGALVPSAFPLESVGGAVPLQSRFYIVRPTDTEFQSAIARQDSVVLVKGARQVGKTSLLARGLQQARQEGARVVLTHFQLFNAAHLASAETLLLALAENLAEQLDLDVLPQEMWEARRGPNPNFRRYLLREVLGKLSVPLVWGMDEIDRLFSCSFGGEIFALFRSWHDERALDPESPWNRLTLAIAYATEAHLFITDLNQSPFNVGTRLMLEDFTLAQVSELNERCGRPLRSHDELMRFHHLVAGQPYLVRRGLDELARGRYDLTTLEAAADREDGPFGDHLRRILLLLNKDPQLRDIVRAILEGGPCPDRASFHRLCSGGVMRGDTPEEIRPRCPLYATYLQKHLL